MVALFIRVDGLIGPISLPSRFITLPQGFKPSVLYSCRFLVTVKCNLMRRGALHGQAVFTDLSKRRYTTSFHLSYIRYYPSAGSSASIEQNLLEQSTLSCKDNDT